MLAEKLILFLDNIWISLPLPSLICILIDCQVQQRYFEYSCHYIFYLLFLENQQTVSFPSSFYNNVHESCHLYGNKLQTHLKVRLSSVEPSQPLPVLMTMINHHVSLQLLVLSHLDIEVWNPLVYHIL